MSKNNPTPDTRTFVVVDEAQKVTVIKKPEDTSEGIRITLKYTSDIGNACEVDATVMPVSTSNSYELLELHSWVCGDEALEVTKYTATDKAFLNMMFNGGGSVAKVLPWESHRHQDVT